MTEADCRKRPLGRSTQLTSPRGAGSATKGGAIYAGVSVPVGAGPDELEAGLAVDFGERRVDGSGEARIIELDREVVAVGLVRALLPGSTQLNIMWCTT